MTRRCAFLFQETQAGLMAAAELAGRKRAEIESALANAHAQDSFFDQLSKRADESVDGPNEGVSREVEP